MFYSLTELISGSMPRYILIISDRHIEAFNDMLCELPGGPCPYEWAAYHAYATEHHPHVIVHNIQESHPSWSACPVVKSSSR